MVEIKDLDILEMFKLGDSNPSDKVFHGIQRRDNEIIVLFERETSGSYTGFLEKTKIDLNFLNQNQIEFLKCKGYEI
jgi:hypothetical protein